MKTGVQIGLATMAIALSPGMAYAHVGVGDTYGFVHGFGHPVGGLDHVLAMVAVGIFGAHLGGRALWLVPAAFVLMMVVGGALGSVGAPMPFVELSIAASVIVLGLAVACQWHVPTVAAMGLVGFFAVFHGHAHGSEMPAIVSGLGYVLGFMLATTILHMAGIGIGLGTARFRVKTSQFALQASGGVMALAGVAIVAGYL